MCTRGSPLQAALRHYSTGHGGGAIIFVYIYSHLAEIDPGGKGGGGGCVSFVTVTASLVY